MNKYQLLLKKLIATGVKLGGAVVLTIVIFVAASMYEDDIMKKKSDASTKLSQDQTLLTTLRTQINSTDAAQKKFIELQGGRNIDDFTANFEAFQAFLKQKKELYRLSVSILPAKESVSDKQELKNFTHDIMVRPKVELTVKAISDVHIFSFIADMQRNAPGLVHIEKVTLKRGEKIDLNEQIYETLKSGNSPSLVEATIQLTWIRLVQKVDKSNNNSAQAAP